MPRYFPSVSDAALSTLIAVQADLKPSTSVFFAGHRRPDLRRSGRIRLSAGIRHPGGGRGHYRSCK